MATQEEQARQWLRENPNDPRAAQVRAKLGVSDEQEPSGLATTARLVEQSWLLDPIQAVGQMLPSSVSEAVSRNLPEWATNEVAAARQAGERHPWMRTGLNIANPAFLLAPELGIGRVISGLGTAARGAIAGGVGALLQPEDDPQDPHFWRKKAEQATLGTVTGGTLGRMAGAIDAKAAATSRAAAQFAKDTNAATQANLRATAADTMAQRQFATDLATYATEVARRKDLDASKNVEWYTRILTPLGLQGQTPARPGSAALAQIQRMIGDRLNAANRQFTLTVDPVLNNTLGEHFANAIVELTDDASRARWQRLFDRRVVGPLTDPLRGGQLAGNDFAEFVTTLNREADKLAKGATRVNPNAANDLAMADALHRMTADIEGAAQGPFLARQERMKAREAYAKWSILSGAAEPEKGGIATAQEVIQHWAQRQGSHDRYNRDIATNPDKQFLTQWMNEANAPKPVKPVKPQSQGQPGVYPPEPKPPAEPPPTLLRRSLRELGPFGIGEILHQTTGIPWWWGYAGARMLRPAAEALSGNPVGGRVGAAIRSRPAAAGAAAGQAAPEADPLSSLIPGL